MKSLAPHRLLALMLLAAPMIASAKTSLDCFKEFRPAREQVAACVSTESVLADETLNEKYEQAMKLVPEKRKEPLRNAQRAWIKFRDAECGLRATGALGEQGRANCLLDQTLERTRQLQRYINMPRDIIEFEFSM